MVSLNSIISAGASNNYTTFYLSYGSKSTVCTTLKKYEELLQPCGFYRVHQSWLVNLSQVKTVDSANAKVVLSNNSSIPIAKQRVKPLLKKLKDKLVVS